MAIEDIIFAKNRHMFGGIEPSNMKIFEATQQYDTTGTITIKLQIPDDTVVNDQTLCSVAGAVIVRRFDRYPENEFDGDVVRTITNKEVITLTDRYVTSGSAASSRPCFYAAFPYTTQGVYNRNPVNRFAVNAPKNLVDFTTLSKYNSETETAAVRIYGEFPADFCDGVIIRRDTGHYPEKPTQYEFVADIERSNSNEMYFTYEDTNVDKNATYYYSAFPYVKDPLVYNSETTSKDYCHTRVYSWVYGYDLDTNDSNPATRVTYPGDVDNASFTPVSHTGVKNSTTDTYMFNYGNWEDCGFMPKPCLLKANGQVYGYLDPNDYSRTVNGSSVSSSIIEEYGCNYMMEWGIIYTKRWEDENGVYHFRCASEKIDDEYDCWCNYDKDNNQISNFYTAIYMSRYVGNKFRSINGGVVGGGYEAANYLEYSANNGSGWTVECLADRLLIQDLLVLIGKSTDTQTVFGGSTDGYIGQSGTLAALSGVLDQSGLFSEYGSSVKVFGMENWWGGLYYRYLNDWRFVGGYYYVKITPGTHDGSTQVGFAKILNHFTNGSGYIDLRNLRDDIKMLATTDNSVDYIKHMKTFPFGRLPYFESTSDIGTADTYECDLAWHRNSGDCIAMVGGSFGSSVYTPKTGAFFMYMSTYTDYPSYRGCALAYKANSTNY